MASISATKPELQQARGNLNLDSQGNRTTLCKLLDKHSKNAAASAPHDEEPSAESDTECDVVLAARVDIGGEEEMRQSGKDALQQELVTQELEVEEAAGKLVVGNRRGLSLAGRLAALEMKNTVQDVINASLQEEVAALKTDITSLHGQVAGLTASVEAYKAVRNRFISSYKRDVLKSDTDCDSRIIASGNLSVHGGDAVADALLYEHGARSDYHVYKKLYGIDPWVIGEISERDMP